MTKLTPVGEFPVLATVTSSLKVDVVAVPFQVIWAATEIVVGSTTEAANAGAAEANSTAGTTQAACAAVRSTDRRLRCLLAMPVVGAAVISSATGSPGSHGAGAEDAPRREQ